MQVRHSSAEVEGHFAASAARGPPALDARRHYGRAGGRPISLGAVGDLMWMPTGAGDFLRERIRKRLRPFDVRFGNLETPVDPAEPPGAFAGGTLRFNTGRPCSTRSRAAGFDVLQVINNHSLDRGEAGLRATLRARSRGAA